MAETQEIDPKTVKEPEIVVEEVPKKVVAAEDGIEGLKKQLEAEKSRREAAERQAQEAAAQVHRAKTEVDDTHLQLISNAIETVKQNSASLKAAYAAAMAASDFNKAAEVQEQMSGNAAKLLQLENGRQAMAERPKPPPPVADKVEALARQLTPKSAAWVRAHPEYATDQNLTDAMVAAHRVAIARGIAPDSDEYFDKVERILDIKKPEVEVDDDDPTELAARPVSRRSSPAAAPVSRSAPTSSGNPRVIRLSAEEREMARLNKMTDTEYYEQKQRIGRDPRYN